jgi:diguanylate cyclase (GGDEF)-like protein
MKNLSQKATTTPYSLYPSWAVLSGIAGMLGIVALLIFSLASEYRDVSQHAQVEVENITQVLEEHTLSVFNKSNILLREMQRNVRPEDMRLAHGAGDLRKQKLHELMKSQVDSAPEVDILAVVNSKGDYIYSSLDPVPSVNVIDRDYFNRQRNDAAAGLVISPPLISHRTGKWTIILSRRLDFKDGSFAGIVISVLNLDYFQQFYRTLNLETHGLVALYDKDLRLAARYPSSEKDMGKIAKLNAKIYIEKGITHTIYHTKAALDGVERLIGFRQVGDLPLIVFAGIADDDYLTEWHQHIWQYSVGAMIFSLLVTWFILLQRRAEEALKKSNIKSQLAEEEIKNLAFYDPLTELPNRRLLQDRLQQALASIGRSGKQGALLFVDLDNFKTLNDRFGHHVGDLLLQQVAQRIESCVREGDTVARLGGDEFVLILEDLSEQSIEAAEQTETVGKKILALLNQPYQLNMHEHHSTASIGATLFMDHQQSNENLLKQADIAMYQAKKAGRNTLRFFDPQMQNTINARSALEGDLLKALELQQFRLYYQIQVDSSYRPLGAEVLIRWLHPERGLVSPDLFIPLAEETGLILSIGNWVLETACAQIKSWEQDAHTSGLALCVNVSAKQFQQSDFVAQVRSTVQRHAIKPQLLTLELTESMLLDNIEGTIATMNALNEIGIQFSLDDFGTGYSSLQYLKQLPLDQLKIDQSFVRDIVTDSSDQAIVSTIIAMARSLSLDIIAEGVETEEQRQLLLKNGCTLYQGYFFGRPVLIEQFEALLKHG